jgi:hypothetical protein
VGSSTVSPAPTPSLLAAISLSPISPFRNPFQSPSSADSYSARLYQSPGVTPTTSLEDAPDEIDTLRPSAAPVTISNVASDSWPSR